MNISKKDFIKAYKSFINDDRIIIYVDMDGVLADFYKLYKEMLEIEPAIKYPQSQYDFFRKLEPIKNAIDTYLWLDSQEQFDVSILSAPSVYNALSFTDKRIWVENHLGMEACHKMILNGQKHKCVGDYLIDDFNKGKGQDVFTGELIHFHQITNNWNDIKDYFNNKYILNEQNTALPTQ
jgi:5'(3')-deoxyribonucleotidase